GTVLPYDGDIEAYRAECLASRSGSARKVPRAVKAGDASGANAGGGAGANGSGTNGAGDGAIDPAARAKEHRQTAAQQRSQLAPLRKRITKVEADMAEVQRKLGLLDDALADGTMFVENPDKATRFAQKRGELEKELGVLEGDWLELSEQYEAASAA
ncbi:MAG: hypothetical protein AAGF32_02600, partial [Pseudomonadota bacterium]